MIGNRRPVPARPAGFAVAMLLLVAAGIQAGAGADSGPGSAAATEILELKDQALISRLWETLYPDSALPQGEYQILLPATVGLPLPGGEHDGGAYLLRNGTTEGRMNRIAWEQAAAFSQKDKVVRWKDDWEEPESEYIPTLWQAFRMDEERILRWTGWPAGVRFEAGTAMSSVPSASPQFERQMDFEWTQKLYRHFLLGAGIHRTEFGGGLVRSDRTASVTGIGADTSRPAFWTDPYWWWSFSAGVPGARYTLYLADRPLPPLFWLETRASSLIRDRKAGKVVKQWTGSSLSRDGNYGQKLDLRLAYVRYRLQWDSEAYAAPVQAIELDDLPAFFGTWGAGFITSSDVAATRVWLDIPDFAFSLARPTAYPSRFRFAFLRMDMAYRNLKSFHLGVSVQVRLENPILNFPGAGS